jgi:hypothetical protein
MEGVANLLDDVAMELEHQPSECWGRWPVSRRTNVAVFASGPMGKRELDHMRRMLDIMIEHAQEDTELGLLPPAEDAVARSVTSEAEPPTRDRDSS